MSSVLRPVRKRKKGRTLGPVEIIRREDYADLELDAKVELIRSLVPLGLMHVEELLDAEVTALAGERYARKAAAIGGRRHGSNPGTVGLAGQRVPIRVPRIRHVAGNEMRLRSYEALQGDRAVNDRLLKRVLYGISCRNYEAAAEAIPGAIGLSGSTVSRGFIQASAAQLREFQERDLSGEDVVAVVLDGKTFADATMVIALGITLSGEKRFLGFVETDTENAQVLTPFLRSLVERGLDVSQGVLVILDGGKGLRSAVRKAFRDRALVHRCQWHKRENVVRYLAKREQASWRQRLQRAYNRPTYPEALGALETLGNVDFPSTGWCSSRKSTIRSRSSRSARSDGPRRRRWRGGGPLMDGRPNVWACLLLLAVLVLPGSGVEPNGGASATRLTAIEVVLEDDGLVVTLAGDGVLVPSSIHEAEHWPPRLVIDLPDVTARVPAVTRVDVRPVDSIRVALHSHDPLVTRVVLDLSGPTSYEIEGAAGSLETLRVLFPLHAEQEDESNLRWPRGESRARDASVGPARWLPTRPVALSRVEDTWSASPPVMLSIAITDVGSRLTPEVLPWAFGGNDVVRDDVALPYGMAAVGVPLEPEAAPIAVPLPATRTPSRTIALHGPTAYPQAQLQQAARDGETPYTGDPVSMDFQGADLRAVLRTFAEISELNIVIDPQVDGTVDVSLTDVPWD